eukprot:scaffold201170_cov33-Tisochrysis_lutea.AAC.13
MSRSARQSSYSSSDSSNIQGPQLAVRLLAGLCSAEALTRDSAATELAELVGVDSDRGAIAAEDGQGFLLELYRAIPEMLNSIYAHEREGALLAIDVLIEAEIDQAEEVGARLSRLASYLRLAVARAEADDELALASCAVVFSHLARVGGALAADTLDAEAKRAMEVLRDCPARSVAKLGHWMQHLVWKPPSMRDCSSHPTGCPGTSS